MRQVSSGFRPTGSRSLPTIHARTPPTTCSCPETDALFPTRSRYSTIFAQRPRNIFPRSRKFQPSRTAVSVSWTRSSEGRFVFFDGTLPRRFARCWKRVVSSSLVGGRRGQSISGLRIELYWSVPTGQGTPYELEIDNR